MDTAMQHIGAMQFFGENFAESYGFAQRFAGEGGHVATLPEIITARAMYPVDALIWSRPYTTASCEYFGTTRGGNDIVIIAHGNGPVSSLSAIEAAYEPLDFAEEARHQNDAGHISVTEFRRLENGDYGDVHIIDFDRVRRAYPADHFDFLAPYEADDDPLLLARMGPDWRQALQKLDEASQREGLVRRTLGMRVPARTVRNDGPDAYWNRSGRDELPYAHLLSVSQSFKSGAGKDEFIAMSLDTHQRGAGLHFIGVRPGGAAAWTHAGPAILQDHQEALLMPHQPMGEQPPRLYKLWKFDTEWYTCTSTEGKKLHSISPEFPVTDIEIVGNPGQVISPGESLFFRYDTAAVLRQAPDSANAYYTGEPQRVLLEGKTSIVAEVHFCKARVDTSLRCVSEEELAGNYELQMQLLARFEQSRSEV